METELSVNLMAPTRDRYFVFWYCLQ